MGTREEIRGGNERRTGILCRTNEATKKRNERRTGKPGEETERYPCAVYGTDAKRPLRSCSERKTKYDTLLKDCEMKHAKEIKELQKCYEDRAKVREEDCKKKMTEHPTTQENQPEEQ